MFSLTKLINKFLSWARSRSVWMIHYCSACGAVEFPPLVTSPLDWERYGFMPVPTPRQADMIAAMGYLTKKTVRAMLWMFRQFPESRVVLAGCNCAATGGLYWDSYATYKRFDDFFKVRYWVPGCMPRSDDWLKAIELTRVELQANPITDTDIVLEDAYKKIDEIDKLEEKWAREYENKLKEQPVVEVSVEEKDEGCRETRAGKVCSIVVKPESIREKMEEAKSKGYDLFVSITAIDRPEKGVIELIYVVESTKDGSQLWVRTYISRVRAEIDSIHDIYPLAYYQEIENYEFFGINFRGHPDLRRWILEGNWTGPPPLRKDVDTADFVVKLYYGGYKYGR